jgi:hypothetical protein
MSLRDDVSSFPFTLLGLAKMRWRYAQRGREGKSRLLDELCEVCGYDRKYAIKLMGGKPITRRCCPD